MWHFFSQRFSKLVTLSLVDWGNTVINARWGTQEVVEQVFRQVPDTSRPWLNKTIISCPSCYYIYIQILSLITYQFLNRQVLRPGTWDFLLDSVSCVVGWMIFGNFCIRSTRSFKDKLIWRLGRGTKWGTQNRVKYAWYQKNKGTLLKQLFMKFDKMQ